MPKIQYEYKKFQSKTLQLIHKANEIITEFAAAGYDMTLRQVFYQLVSRDILPNKQTEYKRLGGLISDARRAGLIDWLSIVDRTRNLRGHSHWDSPADIVSACAGQFRFDLWADQARRIEVWIEKDALVGVFSRACGDLDIPFFSCRGYTSDSEMWSAAQRLKGYARAGQLPTILHFGDHDPSGIDMTRDVQARLELFAGTDIDVRRLALTMDQIEQYDPPPNPAKDTDARFADYQSKYGDESWELDAMTPTVLGDLVRKEAALLRDDTIWAASLRKQDRAREELRLISDNYDDVADYVRGL